MWHCSISDICVIFIMLRSCQLCLYEENLTKRCLCWQVHLSKRLWVTDVLTWSRYKKPIGSMKNVAKRKKYSFWEKKSLANTAWLSRFGKSAINKQRISLLSTEETSSPLNEKIWSAFRNYDTIDTHTHRQVKLMTLRRRWES